MRLYNGLLAVVSALALGGAAVAAGSAPAAAAQAATTDLTIRYLASPAATVMTWRLLCDPAGGDHPDPIGACARLEKVSGDPFAPVPPGSNCMQIWDGPEVAQVVGQWRGQPVSASFDRTDSCEIARWDNLVPVLPPHK